MIDHQIDEEMILIEEVSDEALEAAAFVAVGGFPTLLYGTYCFYMVLIASLIGRSAAKLLSRG